MKCHDCNVEEGELHKPNCDVERCPKCGGQLISCDCSNEDIEGLPRVPWVFIPNLCALCGEVNPEFFTVSDRTWKKYVVPELQAQILCYGCYDRMKRLFPNGWKRRW